MKKIIIAILTLTLIVVAFASCTKTETETTTYEPVIEFPTEEITNEEVTTDVPVTEEVTTTAPVTEESTTEVPTTEIPTTQAPVTETTTKVPETTTKTPETTTKALETTTKVPETTTKAPETTTKAPETTTKPVETTTKAPEPTTEKNNSNYDDSNLDILSVSGYSPVRAGLIYDSNGKRTTYDKLVEGELYFEYDKDGYKTPKTKPYSSGNEPVIDRDHCSVCGKKTTGYDGEHYGCYYGYCERWMRNVNCPECGVFVKANTCHTCKN